MYLCQPAAIQVFYFSKSFGFPAKTGQGFRHNPVSRLDHPADLPDATQNSFFQGDGRQTRRAAGIFPGFMILAGTDVIEILVGSAMCRCPDHVCSTLAAKQARKQIDAAFGLLEVHPPLRRLADDQLHTVELFLRNDRLMAVVADRLAPPYLAKIDRVAKNADHLLLGKQIPSAKFVSSGTVGRKPDAKIAQMPGDGTGRAEFLELIEDAADDLRSFRVDLQFSGIVSGGTVSHDMTTIPQAPVGTVPHNGKGSLCGHLPFKLGEDHDELHHRLAGWHRGIELLTKRNYIDIAVGKERPQVHKILEAACDAVELEADHHVDITSGNVPLEPLKLRAVLVFGALACIDVEFQRADIPILAPGAKLDFLLDFMLLGCQAVAFGGLTLRRHANVTGNP